MGRVRGGEPRGHGRLAELGDDPVPLHLGQPDAGVRLPHLAAGAHVRDSRPRRARQREPHPRRRLQRGAAVGGALRGPAHVRDVPGHGLARPPAPGGAPRGPARGGGARFAARAPGGASSTTSRTSSAHPSRSPGATSRSSARLPESTRTRSRSPSTSSSESTGSWSGCCSWPRPTGLISSYSIEVEVEHFLEDVFMRWSEVAPRVWRLGELVDGTVRADPEALRIALDALLENAVKYTDRPNAIQLSAAARGRRARHRGRRRGLRRPHRGARADLSSLHAGGCGAKPHEGRRRSRPGDRRRDRQGARRTLRGRDLARGIDILVAAARVPGRPDAGCDAERRPGQFLGGAWISASAGSPRRSSRLRSLSAFTSAPKSSASELSHSQVSMMITAASDPHALLYEENWLT